MSKQVYCVYTCNGLKERSSMRLQAVCTSLTKLRTIVSDGIRAEFFCFDDEHTSFKKQAKLFRTAFNEERETYGEMLPETTLNRVKYAYVETAELNDNPFMREIIP